MKCVSAMQVNDSKHLAALDRKVESLRVPLCGTLDLTYRCNLKCAHCYLGGGVRDSETELSTGKWLFIIDEIVKAGCLYLLISGGEPLVRPDFAAIYRYARKRGLLVTVFTNGTLVSEDTAALFAGYPPQEVEVSLYGADAATYRKVTGSADAFAKTLEGIEKLLSCGVRVKLKTVLMTLNRHAFKEMRQLAERFGVDFRFDAAIIPRLDGNLAPTALRVEPEEAVSLELEDPRRLDGWKDVLARFPGKMTCDELYACGAGATSFYIGPGGRLQPCLMVPEPGCRLSEQSFLTGWQEVIPGIKKIRPASAFPCFACENIMLCDFCPSFFRLENGSEAVASDYVCSLARHRYKMVKASVRGNDHEKRNKIAIR